MTIAQTFPSISVDEYSRPFFDAARNGELVIPQCENGHFHTIAQGFGGPVARCHECASATFEWKPASTRSTLVTWTVLHLRNQEPPTRTVGIVELEEGPWLKGLIDASATTTLSAGLPMDISFLPTGDGDDEAALIPVFTPAV